MAASTRSIHSRQRAAGGKSASSTSRLSSPSPSATARRGGHRPYSRNAGRPVKLARGAKRDQSVEQPAGGAVGHRRLAGRFGGRDAILGEQQVDDFRRRFGAQFGRDGDQSVGAAGKIGGEVEGGGGGERDRAGGGVRPGRVAGPRPPSPRPTSGSGSRIFVAISGSGRGQRSRMARTRSNTQSARISASAAGASGTAENAEGGGLCGRRDRIALPCASLQAGCEAVRVHEPDPAAPRGGRSGRGRGWAAGRRGRATATAGSPRARAGRRRRSGGRAARLRRR